MSLLPIAVLLLLLLSALLAASETALFALFRMEHTREQLSVSVRNALTRLMERPLEALVTIIGFNEASNVFAECLATTFLLSILGPIGAWIAAPLMLVVVLIFCDITPKTFALGYPGGIARITARPLSAFIRIIHPIARLVVPSMQPPSPSPVSEAEFKALVHAGEALGQVEPGERELIYKVFDFGNRRVSEVMTPREKIFWLDADTPADRLLAQVAEGHFSRIPVFRGTSDNIIGILHAKDLVTRRLAPGAPRLDRMTRPAYFIPPTKPLGELFDEMRRGRFQMALAVDEYGRVLGLITLEDLLEELFGEIRDEFDYDGPEMTEIGPGEWMVSGAIELDRLRAVIGNGKALGDAGPRTLSGLVLRRLKRVPQRGERFRLGDLEVGVERVHGATIELMRVKR